jgi:GT2 family glycosyltransferase
MSEPLPVSVLIPTIGRVERLAACLDSLAGCDRRAREILVVDQSGGDAVASLVNRFSGLGARVVRCERRGISVGMNLGLREAANHAVLVTHDDCTVAPSWIRTAARLMADDPEMIVTGRVLPAGDDPLAVASTKDEPEAHDFTGELESGALYPNNMALNRSLVLELGGFDERFKTAAEDNDFSYRWLRAGRRLRYEPELVVWHHDWRSHDDLERLYVEYWRWQGVFYAKHLRQRDMYMLRFIARDVYSGARAMAARVVRGRPRWSDWRRGISRGLPAGIIEGWRMFGREQTAVSEELRG